MFDQVLTDAELAESFVFPSELTPEEKAQADIEIKNFRLQKLKEMSPQQRLQAEILRLKFQMEDYFKTNTFDDRHALHVYLGNYMQILFRKQKEFAHEIDLHPTKLNQYLSGKIEPNFALFYRLEKHSGGILKASYWWKLHSIKVEYEIKNNKIDRLKEASRVKNELTIA